MSLCGHHASILMAARRDGLVDDRDLTSVATNSQELITRTLKRDNIVV